MFRLPEPDCGHHTHRLRGGMRAQITHEATTAFKCAQWISLAGMKGPNASFRILPWLAQNACAC